MTRMTGAAKLQQLKAELAERTSAEAKRHEEKAYSLSNQADAIEQKIGDLSAKVEGLRSLAAHHLAEAADLRAENEQA